MKLKDKIILITGAAGGIGATVAKGFAASGATVILLDKNIKALEKCYDEIIKAGYPTPAIYPLDLLGATPSDYQSLKETITEQFGRLDGLLHNAAILGQLAPVEHLAVDQYYNVLQINLHAAFLLTQATLPLLKKSSNASLIFTTSKITSQPQA